MLVAVIEYKTFQMAQSIKLDDIKLSSNAPGSNPVKQVCRCLTICLSLSPSLTLFPLKFLSVLLN